MPLRQRRGRMRITRAGHRFLALRVPRSDLIHRVSTVWTVVAGSFWSYLRSWSVTGLDDRAVSVSVSVRSNSHAATVE